MYAPFGFGSLVARRSSWIAWLLVACGACFALGGPRCWADEPPAGFRDRTAELGLALGNGQACWVDLDNDGDLDLFFTTVYDVASFGRKNNPTLFRNDGGFVFVDVTAEMKLAGLPPTDSYSASAR